MTRIFLGVVGVLYILLAAWCAVQPEKTSESVGFTLRPGAGQSEYLTVYGGLQMALGVAFVLALFRPADVSSLLWLCLLIHGCLVVFRTTGFALYSGIPTGTWIFAGIEWAVFLGAAALAWGSRGSVSG